MDEYDNIFGQHFGVRVQKGFDGAPQFSAIPGKGNLNKDAHSKLLMNYSKYVNDLKRQKTKDAAWAVVQAIDPTGVTNYYDTYKTLKSDAPIQEKVFAVASSAPMFGPLKTRGINLNRPVNGLLKGEKTVENINKVNKVLDKITPRTPLDTKLESYTQKIYDKVNPYKGKKVINYGKIPLETKLNTGFAISNAINKTGDVLNMKDAVSDLYEASKIDNTVIATKKKINNNNSTTMNKTKPTQYAMGGRISSRKRHIAPALIGAGISLIGSFIKGSKAKQAKEDARLATLKQEQTALNNATLQQSQYDATLLREFENEGQEGVQYYKNGGSVAPQLAKKLSSDQISIQQNLGVQGGGMNPNLPISNGGYNTKGGNLVPIGDGVELAVGNRHNDTAIDGVSGIQLSQDGEQVAEIEDKEVVADGHQVYSDRLKYKDGKSYANMMVKLTKERNKLEAKQNNTNSRAEKNTLDRKLASINMAEETLFKTQEAHKEMEGHQTLNKFANGGSIVGQYLRNPKLNKSPRITRFGGIQKGGKYNKYGTNNIGDFRDPNNPNVIVDGDGTPKYPYAPEVYKPKILTAPTDKSIGMDDGSATKTMSILNSVGSVAPVIAEGINNTNNNTEDSLFGNDDNPQLGFENGHISNYAKPNSQGIIDKSDSKEKGEDFDWGKIGNAALSLAPKVIDNIYNASLTKNTPELPQLLHATATPLETRVNINPALAEIRRRTATLRKSVLNNTSNSNNAKSNMVATTLASGRQADELLVSKENQEAQLRNANAQNQQAVRNANTAQDNERSMMEYRRRIDMNTQRSANVSNLVGDINSTVTEMKLKDQFDSNQLANLMDDPKGSKAFLFAKNKEFMRNKSNREALFTIAREKNIPELNAYLQSNYDDYILN